MAEQQQIINIEVDAEQQDEHADDHFIIQVIVLADAGAQMAEAAGARRAKGVDERVIQRHTARQQQERFRHRHHKINAVQNLGGIPQLAGNFVHRGAGHLGAHQMHGTAIPHGQHRHGKHQHAHAAHPVGKTAPERGGTVQRLHIGEDAGTCGGKAGNRFKKGVHTGGDIP